MGSTRPTARPNRQRFWRPQFVLPNHSIEFHVGSPANAFNLSTADPGKYMRRQAEEGDVDFLTGDYLAGKLGQILCERPPLFCTGE
jgi:hypothetical protein